MITGDARSVAESVAQRIGVDEVAAEVLPADKAEAVKRFQSGGHRVAMVGDGVDDAPALAQADVGIAIGAGTDVAVESAGIILVRDDPRDVVGAIRLSRATYRKMRENLAWATGYNALAIPVAAGLLAPIGFVLPMSIGALVMSLSTIVAAATHSSFAAWSGGRPPESVGKPRRVEEPGGHRSLALDLDLVASLERIRGRAAGMGFGGHLDAARDAARLHA